MRALIVYAHPEPRSFNAALRDTAIEVLNDQGHDVSVSDLYAMRFQPVVGRSDFTTVRDADRFNVTLEQRFAVDQDGLAADIAGELEKLMQADLLLLHFPLWWFGMPAILKGWFDRVFLSGTVYSRSAFFERGKLAGKRALVCVTTGGPDALFGPDALNGDIADILSPLHRGILAFTGMSVLPPVVNYHVPYAGDAQRAGMLERYRDMLRRIDDLAPLQMPQLADHLDRVQGVLRDKAQ